VAVDVEVALLVPLVLAAVVLLLSLVLLNVSLVLLNVVVRTPTQMYW
jgi:hypothetical protein